ncbi:MAG: ABC transporter substrate-binding protein [Clostridiales bacterium]|jgi:NitT/TauT family transport system substrate-binding protein|nr:ABC transporter substrate-binding protein [Clostridiales bacterium]
MLNIKKISAVLLIFVLVLTAFAACSKNDQTKDNPTIKVAGLKGPTSMGLVKLMEENENKTSKNSYEFTVAGSADEITPKLVQGEFDIAAIPANLASVLYNNTDGKIQVVAVNTLGVLYVVVKGVEINSLEDLKGKTVYATGKGSTPEYGLKYILSENGIDPEKDLTIEWKSEPAEAVALLSANETGIAMLPQPYVTVALNNVQGLEIKINLNEEWDKLENNSRFITSVLVTRKEFAEKHPELLKKFLDEASASASYINANVEEGANLVEKYSIVAAAVAKTAIPYCNITFIDGSEMKTALSAYLEILHGQNPKSVGGKLPNDNFYYEGE